MNQPPPQQPLQMLYSNPLVFAIELPPSSVADFPPFQPSCHRFSCPTGVQQSVRAESVRIQCDLPRTERRRLMPVSARIHRQSVRGVSAGVPAEFGLRLEPGMPEPEVPRSVSGSVRPERRVSGGRPSAPMPVSRRLRWRSVQPVQHSARRT